MDIGDTTVVADFEAGIGTLTRMRGEPVDVALVVVEPTAKSIEVGRRAVDVLAEGKLAHRVVVVANRLRDAGDRARVWQAFAGTEVVAVPDDPAVGEADRRGLAPLDTAPDSPAVSALAGLADLLLR